MTGRSVPPRPVPPGPAHVAVGPPPGPRPGHAGPGDRSGAAGAPRGRGTGDPSVPVTIVLLVLLAAAVLLLVDRVRSSSPPWGPGHRSRPCPPRALPARRAGAARRSLRADGSTARLPRSAWAEARDRTWCRRTSDRICAIEYPHRRVRARCRRRSGHWGRTWRALLGDLPGPHCDRGTGSTDLLSATSVSASRSSRSCRSSPASSHRQTGAGLSVKTALAIAGDELADPQAASSRTCRAELDLGTPLDAAFERMSGAIGARSECPRLHPRHLPSSGRLAHHGAARSLDHTRGPQGDCSRGQAPSSTQSSFTGYMVVGMGFVLLACSCS